MVGVDAFIPYYPRAVKEANLAAARSHLAFTFHDARGTAESIYCIQYDAPAIQWLTIYGVIPLITSGVTLLAMIYVTACLDWHLALYCATRAGLKGFRVTSL